MSIDSSKLVVSARQGLVVCAGLVLAIKCVALAIDPSVRLFLGDSASYLHTALTGSIPPDRSFLYGWLIGATAMPTRSMTTLLLLQSGFGVLTAMLLYAWLAFGVRVRPMFAIFAGAMLALEPAQLFYERMVMAETTGLLGFMLFFILVSAYVTSGRWYWIAWYALFGVLAVALRISFLPVVLVLGLIAPGVRAFFVEKADEHRGIAAMRLGLHFLMAGLCTFFVHDYYKRWYGELAETAPGYTASAGIFRLGLVAPLIEAEHFRDSGVSPDMLSQIKLDYRDPRLREAQIWSADGFYDVLRRHAAEPDQAALTISSTALRDNPLGLARLGVLTVADYFEPTIARPRLEDDLGRRGLHRSMTRDLKRELRYDATDVHRTNTPATRWFELGASWLTGCLIVLLPLAILALWQGWGGARRELRALLALTSIGLVLAHVLFSHIVSYRYLHPLPWFVLANAAVLWAGLRDRWQFSASTGVRGGIPNNANSRS